MKDSQTHTFNRILLLGWLLVFGLPFVLITDLFPLHRYGMFARLPEETEDVSQTCIELRNKGEDWKKLETGNAYFDQGYFYHIAADAFENKAVAEDLAQKLTKTLRPVPDSIRVCKTVLNSCPTTRLIFPGN